MNPKFKVGDVVKGKSEWGGVTRIILGIELDHYIIDEATMDTYPIDLLDERYDLNMLATKKRRFKQELESILLESNLKSASAEEGNE